MSGCEGYDAIARVYDKLNAEIDYEAWADFFEGCFDRFLNERPQLVLDLACGTGRMTRTLAARGYDMIGVDGSGDMLSEAYSKGGEGILYLLQDMRSFELYGTVGATVCCLDSVNYVVSPKKLQKAFERVHLFLMPGGLFLFDINTVEKLMGLDGQVFLDETEDTYCVWRAEYNKRSKLCSYFMDIFQLDEQSGQWERGVELHEERAYSVEELTAMLSKAGFGEIKVYGDRKMRAPQPGEQRIFFVARKEEVK